MNTLPFPNWFPNFLTGSSLTLQIQLILLFISCWCFSHTVGLSILLLVYSQPTKWWKAGRCAGSYHHPSIISAQRFPHSFSSVSPAWQRSLETMSTRTPFPGSSEFKFANERYKRYTRSGMLRKRESLSFCRSGYDQLCGLFSLWGVSKWTTCTGVTVDNWWTSPRNCSKFLTSYPLLVLQMALNLQIFKSLAATPLPRPSLRTSMSLGRPNSNIKPFNPGIFKRDSVF